MSLITSDNYKKPKFLMKFAFQILQKWADKEGSSALAVSKDFVFVLVSEFSVATISIHHLSCKGHIKNKCLNIWGC